VREFVRHVHFVGIGGAGMSGIAAVLLDEGYIVSGSDSADSEVVQRLANQGAQISIGHSAKHIDLAGVVVYSTAVALDNPELAAARCKGIPVIPRAEMLGELMRFRRGIAVAGTHGKTTTTSLIASILGVGGLDPTFIVGGLVNSVKGNARLGSGNYLVAEADESDASFLHLYPSIAVVTNIDRDHMENYDWDFNRLIEIYFSFLQNLPFYGLAVLCGDDPRIKQIVTRLRKPTITYGLQNDADYWASGVEQIGSHMKFLAHRPAADAIQIKLSLPGKHNVQNAMAAIAVCDKLGVSSEHIFEALESFEGIGRRFEILGKVRSKSGSAILVDDYAHHPRELMATIEAAKNCWPDRNILVVFQPHRYSRTKDLFDDFVDLLSSIARLVICEVYPAGENPISGADGQSLCKAIESKSKLEPIFLGNVMSLKNLLDSLLEPDDVLLTMGAGNIGKVARSLLEHTAQSVKSIHN
tara:strand:+ start:25673 stop:27082 length:1410 start_codon:yes stop_codon:yes gene_type:complete